MDAKESPTVVLDRADSSLQIQTLVSSDPFRDVIKTEPAPDLPSLIEDMIPYLAGQGISTSNTTNATNSSSFDNDSQIFDFNHRNQSPKVNEAFPESGNKFDNPNDTLLYDTHSENKEISLQSNYLLKTNQSEKNSSNLSNENSPSLNESTNKTEDFFHSEESESIFSLDSVLDLFFSDTTTASGEITKQNDTKQTEVRDKMDFEMKNSEKTEFNDGIKINEGTQVDDVKFKKGITTLKKDPEVLKTEFQFPKIGEIGEQLIKNHSTEVDTNSAENNTKFQYSSRNPSANIINKTISPASINIQGITNLNVDLNSESKAKNTENDITGLNILKLAGCNIYGRMYRVGRIITELTSSCRECKCTEVGVQCKQLKC